MLIVDVGCAQQFLDVLGGDEEEHAVLLACYLLYLDFDAYLVHGTLHALYSPFTSVQ